MDPREAMWWLFAPPRAVAVQSPPVRACQFPDRVSGPVAKLIQLLLELDMERRVVDLVQHAPDHVHPGAPVLAAL